MSFYERLLALRQLTDAEYHTVEELFEAVRSEVAQSLSATKIPESAPVATIVLRFSVSFVSTYIQDNRLPEESLISEDDICHELTQKLNDAPLNLDVFKKLSSELTTAYEKHNNIWIDGAWLNLFKRIALIEELHENGYKISIINMLREDLVQSHFDKLFNDYFSDVDKNTIEYFIEESKLYFMQDSEVSTNHVDIQTEQNMFSLGADSYTEL